MEKTKQNNDTQRLLLSNGGFVIIDEISALTRVEDIFNSDNWFAILKSGKEIQLSRTDYINLQKHIKYVKD